MVYALEMFFDSHTEEKILNYFNEINNLGISSYLIDVESLPHVTIGCFNDIDSVIAQKLLKDFCEKRKKFEIVFPSMGVFTHPKPCVFLAPVVTEELMGLHRELHNIFDFCSTENFGYYLPDSWVPHCAVDISADINTIRKSTDYIMKNFKPFKALITNIGWVEITKPVRRLERFYLK